MTAARIRLIAPSGYPHDRDAATRGVERLQRAGCIVERCDVLDRRHERFAGTDDERVADFQALADARDLPGVALAVRGGYGATRLLEHLPYAALRERLAGADTLLVGHSDFTAIGLALLARCGLTTFNGPMLGRDFGAAAPSAFTWAHFWDTACAPEATLTWRVDGAAEASAAGPLWGGNLAMLCSLVGTPYFPHVDDGILFVEDVAEPPFRVERMLYQLHLAGVLRRQQALLLGQFSDCRTGPYDGGYGLASAFARIRALAPLPVVTGLPIGHVADKASLPLGAAARLRVGGGTATLAWSGHPHLPPAMHPGYLAD